MEKIKAKEIEEKYVSKCCNAEIEVMESEMPDSGSRMEKQFGFKCGTCKRLCEIKERIS